MLSPVLPPRKGLGPPLEVPPEAPGGASSLHWILLPAAEGQSEEGLGVGAESAASSLFLACWTRWARLDPCTHLSTSRPADRSAASHLSSVKGLGLGIRAYILGFRVKVLGCIV